MTKKETLNLKPGDKVYCTVTTIKGWYTVTDIRIRDGYIKISGYNTWNPPHNFSQTEA
ncbi:MAG TPA: hypothetical protein VE971_00465 [Candidatus Eisenbacteria bacterium]|nr:hypothetical protein [Candidatus Eisenbacteria bacterium]